MDSLQCPARIEIQQESDGRRISDLQRQVDHASTLRTSGLLVKTRDANRFYLTLNQIALNGVGIDAVAPADDDVNSVYEYLIGAGEATK